MKKTLKVILIIIASILILLGLMVVISLASYWKETSLIKEKFKALPTESIEAKPFYEYKEIPVGWWGFGLPSKQVIFTNANTSFNPCWALGNNTDFIYSSTVKKKSLAQSIPILFMPKPILSFRK